MGQEGWGKAQLHPQMSVKPVQFQKHPQIQGSLPKGLIFRPAEHPLIPTNLHPVGTTDCSGRGLVEDRDTGTQPQPAITWKRQRPVIQPGRGLDGVFTTFSSSEESCWEAKDTHFSSKHILNCSPLPSCPEAEGPQWGRKLNCWDGMSIRDPAPVEWPLLAARAWGARATEGNQLGLGAVQLPRSVYVFR